MSKQTPRRPRKGRPVSKRSTRRTAQALYSRLRDEDIDLAVRVCPADGYEAYLVFKHLRQHDALESPSYTQISQSDWDLGRRR